MFWRDNYLGSEEQRKGTRGKMKMDNKQTAFTLVLVDVIPDEHPIKT